MNEISSGILMVQIIGVDANDPNREALATELLMRESSELKATEDEETDSV